MAPLLVRVAEETDDNNNAKFMEYVLYARDTMNALRVSHSSQMPCERGHFPHFSDAEAVQLVKPGSLTPSRFRDHLVVTTLPIRA